MHKHPNGVLSHQSAKKVHCFSQDASLMSILVFLESKAIDLVDGNYQFIKTEVHVYGSILSV